MDTYRASAAGTGHYRHPGTQETYCGRDVRGPFRDPARMCRPCVKAEARDRTEATATAEAWLDQPAASPLATAALLFGAQVEAVDNRRTAERAEAAGTWRAEWISSRATSTEPTLFDVEPEAEQGALFA